MSRTSARAVLATSALACGLAALAAQPPAVPVVENGATLPQALTSAELRFAPDGGKLLAVRHYGRNSPLVTVHVARPGPRGPDAGVGHYLYFPLTATDVYAADEPRFGHEGASAALSPDGNVLLTSSFQTVRLWDITRGHKGQPRALTLDHPGNVRAAFTNGGKQVLSMALIGGKASRDKVGYEVRLWDVGTGKSVGEPVTGVAAGVTGPSPVMKSLLYAPDGASFLAAYGGRNTVAESVQLWDAKTLRPVGEPLPVSGDVHHFGRDGKTLLAVAKSEIALWDIVNRKPVGKLSTPEIPRAAAGGSLHRLARRSPWFAVHPDGTGVLYRKGDQVQWWDLGGEKPVEKLTLKHPGRVNWVAISPDGKRAATACDGSDEILVWSLETGKPVLRVPHGGAVEAIEFSPDGGWLATADAADVHLWRLEAGK